MSHVTKKSIMAAAGAMHNQSLFSLFHHGRSAEEHQKAVSTVTKWP